MNMYVFFATFAISSAIILACLDHLKMRFARNLFLILTFALSTHIPVAIWGEELIILCTQHHQQGIVQTAITLFERGIDFSNHAFAYFSLLLTIVALISSVATVIVIVHTARSICKFVQELKKEQQPRKRPSKQNFEPRLAHSKIFYKRILYLRLCRLNS